MEPPIDDATTTGSPQTPGTSARQVRPPYGSRPPLPGVSEPPTVRRTARLRPLVAPVLATHAEPTMGHAMTDAYVRRYWVAAIGPGAVADLLRLAAAARSGRSLPLPTHLSVLVSHGLVGTDGGKITVRRTVPPLPLTMRDRLPIGLRRELVEG